MTVAHFAAINGMPRTERTGHRFVSPRRNMDGGCTGSSLDAGMPWLRVWPFLICLTQPAYGVNIVGCLHEVVRHFGLHDGESGVP